MSSDADEIDGADDAQVDTTLSARGLYALHYCGYGGVLLLLSAVHQARGETRVVAATVCACRPWGGGNKRKQSEPAPLDGLLISCAANILRSLLAADC